MILAQPIERKARPQRLAMLHPDTADLQEPCHLIGGEIAGRLVAGDAVFVQAARLGTRIEDHHLMPLHRQTMRGRKARRPRAHDRHALARRLGAGEGMHTRRHQAVGGETLQAADLDRLALGHLTHADLLTKLLGRADAGAHAAKDVLRKDRLRRRLGRAGGDLADEQGNVDRRRTGRHAGRVMAEITAIRRHARLMRVKPWRDVGEISRQRLGAQTARHDSRRQG